MKQKDNLIRPVDIEHDVPQRPHLFDRQLINIRPVAKVHTCDSPDARLCV